MGLVIHMHQSLAISQNATWSTVNAVSNPLFAQAPSAPEPAALPSCPPPVPPNRD